ncbi:MAG: capsid cement protein, partial [Candidatus Heimdallarchaeaceae archaeon]
MNKNLIITAIILLFCGSAVFGSTIQQLPFFTLDGTYLVPRDSSWDIGTSTTVYYGDGSNLTGISGTGGSLFSTSTGFTYLTATTSDLVLGDNATATAPFWIDVSTGDLVITGNLNSADSFLTSESDPIWLAASSSYYTSLEIDAFGYLTSVTSTNMASDDFGAFSCDGTDEGCSLDTSYLELTGGTISGALTVEGITSLATTTATGTLDVTGTVTANSFSGDGSNLTGIGTAAASALTLSCKAAEDITKGQVVYISGATGQFPQVSLADNTNSAKHAFVGVAAETKTTGQTILVRVRGELNTLDTSDWSDGDALYLSTNGDMVTTTPTTGAVSRVGYVSYSHANQGKMVIMHHSPHAITVPSGEDTMIRMGDSAGANKLYFKDYANAEVGYIDSDGNADFTSLILDSPLLDAYIASSTE